MAAVEATTVTASEAKLKANFVEDNEILGEITLEVSDFSLRFASLLKEEIIQIFHNKFKPINFYR